MYLHLCYANRSLVSSASVVQASSLFPASSLSLSPGFTPSLPSRHTTPPSHCSFPPPSYFHPLPPPPHRPISLCLCFPLPDCFAVDLTAMINDLKASGKQTELALLVQTSLFLICQLRVCSHGARYGVWKEISKI